MNKEKGTIMRCSTRRATGSTRRATSLVHGVPLLLLLLFGGPAAAQTVIGRTSTSFAIVPLTAAQTQTSVTTIAAVGNLEVSTLTQSAATTTSRQAVSGDFNVGSGGLYGSSTANTSLYGGGVMGNIIGTGGGTATNNILFGVYGKFDWTGTHLSTYPKGGVIGEVGDTVTGAAATGPFFAVGAVMGGDTGQTTTKAMFGVDWLNSTITSRAEYGLDLEGATHDTYLTPRYGKAFIRLGGRYSNAGTIETVNDLCILTGTAAATNGTSGTGAGDCAAGSLYIRQSGSSSTLVINTNTKASPTWSAIP